MNGYGRLLTIVAMLPLGVLVVGFTIHGPTANVETGETSHSFKTTVEKEVELGYLQYVPPEYNETEKDWPLMVFLHGMGERGDNLDLVKKHGPPKLIAEGKDFPFIVVSPQCPQWSWWPTEVEALDALIDRICSEYRVDEDRIYLTGLSMGGFGTWSLACHSPDRFAAIAPICGGGEPEKAEKIAHLPVWVFHGAKDNVVPVKRSKEMVEALKEAGGTPKLTIYPDAGHDAWTQAYNDEELYDWFLKHKRGE